MNRDLQLSPMQKTLFVIAAAVIVLGGIRSARFLLTPSLLALLIAVAVLPAQQWLGHRIGRLPAYFAMLAIVLVAILAVTALLGVSVSLLVARLAQYTGRADDVYREALRLFGGVGVEAGQVNEVVKGQQVQSNETLLEALQRVVEGIGDFGLIVTLALFMLADAVRLREKAQAFERLRGAMFDRIQELIDDVRSYVRITAVSALATGALATAVFFVLGVPMAPLWGLLVGLLKFIPVIGFWIGLAPAVALGALEHSLLRGLAVFALAVIVNQVVDQVLKTKLVGSGLNLSPFTVIFSLVFWAFILGPLGAVLAIPLTLAFKHLVLDADERFAWLSVLMAARVEEEEAAQSPQAVGA